MESTIILLHAGQEAVTTLVLALLLAHGNFFGCFPAALWFAVDLLVNAMGTICWKFRWSWYRPIFPDLMALDAAVFVIATLWLALDWAQDRHPLSGRFCIGFLAQGVVQVVQMQIYRGPSNRLEVEAIGAVTFAIVYAYILASMFLPPASTDDDKEPAQGDFDSDLLGVAIAARQGRL